MSTAKRKRVDSLEKAIEAALDDRNFISYKAAWSFVDRLQDVANRVGASTIFSPVGSKPAGRPAGSLPRSPNSSSPGWKTILTGSAMTLNAS